MRTRRRASCMPAVPGSPVHSAESPRYLAAQVAALSSVPARLSAHETESGYSKSACAALNGHVVWKACLTLCIESFWRWVAKTSTQAVSSSNSVLKSKVVANQNPFLARTQATAWYRRKRWHLTARPSKAAPATLLTDGALGPSCASPRGSSTSPSVPSKSPNLKPDPCPLSLPATPDADARQPIGALIP